MLIEAAEGTAQIDSASDYDPAVGGHADSAIRVQDRARCQLWEMGNEIPCRSMALAALTVAVLAVAACGRGEGQPARNVVGSLGTPGVEAQFAASTPTQTVTGFEDSRDGQLVLLRDGASGFDLNPATRVLTVYFNSATSKRQAAQQALEQTGYFSSVKVLP